MTTESMVTQADEQAVAVCPQCEGEGGYPDGLDEAACHTECTRCAGNGWIVDLARLQRHQPQEREAVLDIVADALDCFWNAAIGSARETQDSTALAISGSLAEGFAAMATRLRETTLTTPAPAVSTDEFERLVAHVRGGGPHEWDYRDLTDGAFIEDAWPSDAAEFLSRLWEKGE